MVEARRVSPCSGVELVTGVCNLAEEFQSRRVGGTKGSECGCNKLVTCSLHVCSMFMNFYTFASPNYFWVGTRKYIKRDSVVGR